MPGLKVVVHQVFDQKVYYSSGRTWIGTVVFDIDQPGPGDRLDLQTRLKHLDRAGAAARRIGQRNIARILHTLGIEQSQHPADGSWLWMEISGLVEVQRLDYTQRQRIRLKNLR